MKALTINKPSFKLPIFRPNIKPLSYSKNLGLGRDLTQEELLKEMVTKYNKTFTIPLEEGSIEIAIKEVLGRVYNGVCVYWEELENSVALNIIKDEDIKTEVEDYFADRDSEAFGWFTMEVYKGAFKNYPELLQKILTINAEIGSGNKLESLIATTLDNAKDDILRNLLVQEFIKVTDNTELFYNEVCYSEGVCGTFTLKGTLYHYNFRDY